MFQQTAQRLACVGNETIQTAAPLIVTGEEHRFLAYEQLRQAGIHPASALLEPAGRNTAPALNLAALAALQNGDDPVLVVTPDDQIVVGMDAFAAATQIAIERAVKGGIVLWVSRPVSQKLATATSR